MSLLERADAATAGASDAAASPPSVPEAPNRAGNLIFPEVDFLSLRIKGDRSFLIAWR